MTIRPASDRSFLVVFGESISLESHRQVFHLTNALQSVRSILNLHPAYASLLVEFDPRLCDRREIEALARERAMDASAQSGAEDSRTIEIPVKYGGEFGPDLAHVAAHCGLDSAEVVARHSGARYLVNAVGFVPGFPYLGGLPESLRVPRRPTPRTNVPAGSVGIGGAQTGIYPMSTPGGWHLIGRTPLDLFKPAEEVPCLLHMGDRVRIRAITAEEFATWN